MIIVAVMGWIIPGCGHFILGRNFRAAVILVSVVCAFVIGIWVGSVGVIDPVGQWPWYIGQVMTSPMVALVAHYARANQIVSFGKPFEIGQIYTTIAGLLNLFCVVNAVYLAYTNEEQTGE